MGNCLGCNSFKRQRDLEDTVSYKITNWIDNSDFSSKPDLEVVCTDPCLLDSGIRPVEEESAVEALEIEEGYLTAVEHIEESEDEHPIEPSPNTSYETSDEAENMLNMEVNSGLNEDFQNNNVEIISSDETSSVEAEERVNSFNYELRPIRPMPTPIRDNVLSPSIRLEQIVNDSGRVSHKRLMKYMELRQKKPLPLNFPEVA